MCLSVFFELLLILKVVFIKQFFITFGVFLFIV